jgi:hypothetical protein
MVVDDADEMSAGKNQGQLHDLSHQFLTEVRHHVGDLWHQIGGKGQGQGALGLLFGAQDEATLSQFLLLAGLATNKKKLTSGSSSNNNNNNNRAFTILMLVGKR